MQGLAGFYDNRGRQRESHQVVPLAFQRQLIGLNKLGRRGRDIMILMATGVDDKKDAPPFAVILALQLAQQRPVRRRQFRRCHRPVAAPAAAAGRPLGKTAQPIGPAMKGGQKGRQGDFQGPVHAHATSEP
ncbi:hypothetical protein [Acetobacterium malicum]|uniref:hypothetical protein n=1 Tax=Acetobacterium malicum TaxID=52692 RepID=UPI001FAC5A41|nr:hypothetical protein [Acetobacterium malicum]